MSERERGREPERQREEEPWLPLERDRDASRHRARATEGSALRRREYAQRVLIVAPVGRDASLLGRVLEQHHMHWCTCVSSDEVTRAIGQGVGVLLFTEEALSPPLVSALVETIRKQPTWSDLPIIILADPEPLAASRARPIAELRDIASVTVLERPARAMPLVSVVSAALRARQRQYEIRDLVDSERAAREAAEVASQVKDEFLATVSHELRTPLSAILLWTRLLATGELDDEKVRQALSAVERSAEAQSKLIEDLLDISRMISGKLKLDLDVVDIVPIARAAIDVIRPAAEAKCIAVETVFCLGKSKSEDVQRRCEEDEQKAIVRGDPARLQQILWNLLSNAVKFTSPNGQITLRVVRDDIRRVRIEVADTGQGIPPSFLPYVFDRFRQGDATLSRRSGGLGLGLAISRQLVELHGGSIKVQSAEGRGSVFTVNLPTVEMMRERAVDVQRHAPRTGDERPLENIRVLLVEDDQDTRDALVLNLEHEGADVTAVGTAANALEVLQSNTNAGRAPDILLSDLGLPGINGYELLERVRAMRATNAKAKPIPAALITAYVGEGDRQRAFDAGFAAHLAKPVEPKTVVATVLELVRGKDVEADRQGTPREQAANLRPRRNEEASRG